SLVAEVSAIQGPEQVKAAQHLVDAGLKVAEEWWFTPELDYVLNAAGVPGDNLASPAVLLARYKQGHRPIRFPDGHHHHLGLRVRGLAAGPRAELLRGHLLPHQGWRPHAPCGGRGERRQACAVRGVPQLALRAPAVREGPRGSVTGAGRGGARTRRAL